MREKIKFYDKNSIRSFPKFGELPKEIIREVEIVSQVFPFRVNNYVLENLLDWDNWEKDPIFNLNFYRKEMLEPNDFLRVEKLLKYQAKTSSDFKMEIEKIRAKYNPHPGDQIKNVPTWKGQEIQGCQHKYNETILIFPKEGQLCQSYCTFCFRWAQFVATPETKFKTHSSNNFLEYIKNTKTLSDIVITSGDPMIMNSKNLDQYISPFLKDGFEHITNIRIGSKSISYWPMRFFSDPDSEEVLRLFEKVKLKGKHLSFMAHINHPREISTESSLMAIKKIQDTGAIIRTQSPLLRQINDSASTWKELWENQLQLGLIPYYMFLERNTGPFQFFSVPLFRAFDIFSQANSNISGLGRTARGPSMSTSYGKVSIEGVGNLNNKKFFMLKFIQAINPEWVNLPFFAEYNKKAYWLDDLRPIFNDHFFFEESSPKRAWQKKES